MRASPRRGQPAAGLSPATATVWALALFFALACVLPQAAAVTTFLRPKDLERKAQQQGSVIVGVSPS